VSLFRYIEKISSRYACIVHFTDEELNDLKSALKASKLAKPTWESSENAKGEWGISSAWMKEAKRVWENEFDWFVDSFHLFPSLHETYLATCRLDRRKQERR
jgi:microsomal epoxide hydrolase